eukprot:CAMPEP_0117014620 /NCGR_PEP_ID=MMETSP0472-20121206/11827_1 /TAXON_ID=693140 ORGANISM="Tiarina fusus, Strain LIS" /NCGR_SAMPLE_ID=MMETSP0472 /ASSEMBLY_ACC=CAM_ASM_000603 /LENGTH=60 /DNA_ID=CAMNT_0004718225 /DNA_START=49 /DNA_END=231 /DNA_ORIENTATION=-
MAEAKEFDETQVDDNYDPEAEVGGTWAKLVNLEEISTTTGEENEDILVKFRSKLYRWNDN